MASNKDLARALLFLRVGIAAVFLIWAIDKLYRPEHAALVFEHFYFIKGLSVKVSIFIGVAQAILTIAFLVGFKKKLTYGSVFILHLISTVASYKQYLSPLDGVNILFFTSLPMLAACYALYVLREHDTLYVMDSGKE